jgi:hypothetical protein
MSTEASPKSTAPTKADVQDELLKYWDADTPLTLAALGIAYAQNNSLNDVGILANEAEGYVNKYNSIVFRVPGKGPLVKTSEAAQWANKPMADIVKIVFDRSQP